MRAGLTDFGIAERPSCRCQRSITWAADLPCWLRDLEQRRVVEGALLLPRYEVIPPMGDHACVGMPCSACNACSAVCWKYGCTSIWFTAGTTDVVGQQALEVLGHEVAHADRAHPAVSKQLLERAVGVERALEADGSG